MLHRYLIIFAALFFLASCEKAEDAIVLPPRGTATPDSVELGNGYEKQVYYDFETAKPVFSSNIADWDLAFEASAAGRHVFLNGGRAVFIYNTHQQDIQKVTTLPANLSALTDTGWQYDNPNGLSAGTAMGDWWNDKGLTKGEVYIVRLSSGLQKMRLLSANTESYAMEWMPLYGSGTPTQLLITKDSACNYVYFSFAKGITRMEPPARTSWDIVFTQYRELVYDGAVTIKRAVPYTVTGALLNPYNTAAAADSSDDFSTINLAQAQASLMHTERNTIGYDWKSFSLGSANPTYTVNPHKNYVVSTQEGRFYKLHFIGFYREKGAPLFEFERLK